MSRPSRTLQRLERVLTLVPWLLDHPGAHIDDVARQFDVPAEELLGDLDLLGYCGLPGYGGGDLVEVSVVGGAVTVRMADFFRRPLRLSIREAVTLLLAARALGAVEGLAEAPGLRGAAAKLERLLSATAGEQQPQLLVDVSAVGEEHLGALREAVADNRVVRLTYRSASRAAVTEREVEPSALVGAGGAWYLQGYCRTARGPRDFRLDRIRDLTVTQERFAERQVVPGPPVYRPEPADPEVVLDLGPRAWWAAEWAVVEAVEDRGDTRRVHLRTRDLEWAARLVLRLAGAARVVGPESLAERVAHLARSTRTRYAS
jgi:predicted DNA-binding transcriptional regulator YafY